LIRCFDQMFFVSSQIILENMIIGFDILVEFMHLFVRNLARISPVSTLFLWLLGIVVVRGQSFIPRL